MKDFIMQVLDQIKAFILPVFENSSDWIPNVIAYGMGFLFAILLLGVAVVMLLVPIIYIRAIVRELRDRFF